MAQQITYRRVYEDTAPRDGKRVLVDRVWPRGMRKEDAHLDEWLRDVAPSSALRKWYGHIPGRFAEFRRRYLAELRDAGHREATAHLRDLAARQTRTADRHQGRGPQSGRRSGQLAGRGPVTKGPSPSEESDEG